MTAHLVPLNTIKWAANIVDTSGVMDKVCQWDLDDRKYRGGRPPKLSARAVFIAWLVVALEQEPLYATRVAEVLSDRLTPEAAAILRVAFEPVPYEDMQNRVERATNRLLDVLDYKPIESIEPLKPALSRQRALLKREWPSVVDYREQRADELEDKRMRFFHFANDLLHAQYESLPESAKTRELSVAVDATFLAAPSKGMSSERREKRRDDQTIPMDPDAGWYVRTYDQRDSWDGTETHARKVGYGYESELAILISNDSDYRESVPHIIVGFNFHTPNTESNYRAREIFDDILAWGHGLGYVIGDQAYLPNANPSVLQTPLREAGAMLSMRYPDAKAKASKGEGVIQAQAHGAFMLEGRWMCPATPMTHREIMVRYNKAVQEDKKNKTLTKAIRAERELSHRQRRYAALQERAKWELYQKDKQANGNLVMSCPGSGTNRSLECPLKPNEPAPREGRSPLPVENPPKAPGHICTNGSSVTFDADLGAKYRQHHRYGSQEWDEAHTYGRQTIESFNNLLKHADNSLHDSTNRRMRGEAAQAFQALIGVIAMNGRIIFKWLEEEYDETRPAPEPNRRQKRTNRHVSAPRRTKSVKKGRGMPAGRRARYGLIPV